MVNLFKPCDACGSIVGGDDEYCPKCQIYFYFIWCYHLRNLQKELTIRVDCPMCGKPLQRE